MMNERTGDTRGATCLRTSTKRSVGITSGCPWRTAAAVGNRVGTTGTLFDPQAGVRPDHSAQGTWMCGAVTLGRPGMGPTLVCACSNDEAAWFIRLSFKVIDAAGFGGN